MRNHKRTKICTCRGAYLRSRLPSCFFNNKAYFAYDNSRATYYVVSMQICGAHFQKHALGAYMKIVVVHPPKAIAAILSKIFKIKKS